ncbi:MAG: hypothetical protein AAF401_02385 [Pseudomonadota bacterium]
MHFTTLPTATLSAGAFVAALACVGVLSHSEVGPLPAASALNGEFQSGYENSFKTANPLREIAIGAYASLRYSLLNEASAGAIVGKDGWLFTAEEIEVHEGFDANIRASAEKIARTRDALAANGAEMLAVIVPDKADIYAHELGSERPDAVRGRLSTFLAYLNNVGINRVGASEILQQEAASGEVFMRDDTHWSPLGAKAVADAIGLALVDHDIARTNVETLSLGPAPFDGDLLAFVPTGPLRGLAGPEQRSIERFETTVASAGGLFGDAPVDVALVGTSFSAKQDWHFEGFLKQALSADVLNFSAEGAGPFAPMDAFIESEDFANNPPKIVIWEIPVRYISKDLNQ